MIISDLYTADVTLTYTSPQTKLTKAINDITITTQNFSDAYWLGWIKYENIPQVFKTSQLQYTGTGNTRKVKFADITTVENVDFTYSGTHSTSYNNGNYSCEWIYHYYNETYGKWTYSSYYGYSAGTRLINEMEYQAFAMGTLNIRIAVATDYAIGRFNVTWATSTTHSFTIQEFIEFMNGNFSINFAFYDYNTSQMRTVTVTGTDFGNDGLFQIPDTTHKLFINYYEFTKRRRNVYNSYDNIIPLVNTHITADEIQSEISLCRSPNPTGDFALLKFTVDTANEKINGNFYNESLVLPDYGTGNEIPVNISGINAEFSLEELLEYENYPKINGNAVIGHNADQPNNTNFRLMLYPIIKLSEIYKHASLFRWTDTSYADAGYNDGHIFYPKVNLETNEILCELITGNQEIVPQLASWEYGTIISNNYKPSDKPTPTPVPTGGIDTKPKETGTNLPDFTSIRRVSGNAFNSFYKVPLVGVEEMGYLLSQSANTFWQALGTATDDKQSNLLDYVISLKWYPVDFENGTAGNVIQFGYNGNAQLTFSAGVTIEKINYCYQYISMGSVFVPTYLDNVSFLDFEPYTECMLYLPYIGFASVPSNKVVGHTISFDYIIDITTGIATAFVSNGQTVIFTGSGQIGVDIAVSGNDIITQSQQISSAVISGTTKLLSGAMTAGFSMVTENAAGTIGSIAGTMSGIAETAISVASAKRGKPLSVSSGSGFGASFNPQTPCILVERDCIKIPTDYGHTVGYISGTYAKVSELSGYTELENPDLSGISGINESEMQLLSDTLKSGFYA